MTTIEERNDAEDEERLCGLITSDEAKEIALRFINGHFRNADRERPRIHIPADPKRDDDIRIMAFIRQSERNISAARARAIEECAQMVTGAEMEEQRGAIDDLGPEVRSRRAYARDLLRSLAASLRALAAGGAK